MSEKEKVFALLRCVWYRRKGNEGEENKTRMSLGSLSSFGKVKNKKKEILEKIFILIRLCMIEGSKWLLPPSTPKV